MAPVNELSKRVDDHIATHRRDMEQNAQEHKELSDKIDGVAKRVDRSTSEIRSHIDNVLLPAVNRKSVVMQVLKWCGEHPRLALSFAACLMIVGGAISVGDIGTLVKSFFGP